MKKIFAFFLLATFSLVVMSARSYFDSGKKQTHGYAFFKADVKPAVDLVYLNDAVAVEVQYCYINYDHPVKEITQGYIPEKEAKARAPDYKI